MDIDELARDNYLMHYGIKRRSGRYPWGSGRTPEERGRSFQGMVDDLRKQGVSEANIAKAFDQKIRESDPSAKEGDFNTKSLRATVAIAANVKRQADIAQAERLKAKNMSNSAIAEQMFGSKSKESNVRALLAPGAKDKADILQATSDMLRKRVDDGGKFVDIGKGSENHLEGISGTRLGTAASMLESEGYVVHRVPIKQLGTGKDTNTKVLCPPGTKWSDVMKNRENIVGIQAWTNDGGRNYDEVKPPLPISSKRVQVVYGPEGGDKADGVIYVRPGVKDLDMGGTHYAQVRIAVDGTHYLKGMAVQKEGLPDGVDLQFNTNKKNTGNKLDAMKLAQGLKKNDNGEIEGKIDPDNYFGSSIRRQIQEGEGENRKPSSVMNIVNEEEKWDDWSRNMASQMLSKQKPELIKTQLDLTYAKKKDQLDEIMSLTNPTVKAALLKPYSESMDSAAVHLKAAAMPNQKTHVILPINSLKENEVYAPNYRDGERVVLIRYPHGGTFEIPELTVNNRNPEGKKIIGPQSTAAVGINHKVAARLSGADFDGDTVVVIPNNQKRITTSEPLKGLEGFDPQHMYPGKDENGKPIPGIKFMTNTQTEMGMISNLITDMTIQGANHDELAAAVRHSMVVIDAEKHSLNYRQSELDNNIGSLRQKYQGSKQGGASTLLSRSTGEKKIDDYKLRPVKAKDKGGDEGGPIDPVTGELKFVKTGKTYNKPVVNKDGELEWVPTPVKRDAPLGGVYQDKVTGEIRQRRSAHELIDGEGTVRERLYADYSDKVRGLANQARLEMLHNTKPLPYSESAKKVYAPQVASLNAKLNTALKNAPLERQAQVIANAVVKQKLHDTPGMDPDVRKKLESQELKRARDRIGATKQQVEITDKEWEAIQAGAIRHTKLRSILDNANIDEVKKLATPRTTVAMTPTKIGRARALANAGYTQREIADELGVSVSTLSRALRGE